MCQPNNMDKAVSKYFFSPTNFDTLRQMIELSVRKRFRLEIRRDFNDKILDIMTQIHRKLPRDLQFTDKNEVIHSMNKAVFSEAVSHISRSIRSEPVGARQSEQAASVDDMLETRPDYSSNSKKGSIETDYQQLLQDRNDSSSIEIDNDINFRGTGIRPQFVIPPPSAASVAASISAEDLHRDLDNTVDMYERILELRREEDEIAPSPVAEAFEPGVDEADDPAQPLSPPIHRDARPRIFRGASMLEPIPEDDGEDGGEAGDGVVGDGEVADATESHEEAWNGGVDGDETGDATSLWWEDGTDAVTSSPPSASSSVSVAPPVVPSSAPGSTELDLDAEFEAEFASFNQYVGVGDDVGEVPGNVNENVNMSPPNLVQYVKQEPEYIPQRPIEHKVTATVDFPQSFDCNVIGISHDLLHSTTALAAEVSHMRREITNLVDCAKRRERVLLAMLALAKQPPPPSPPSPVLCIGSLQRTPESNNICDFVVKISEGPTRIGLTRLLLPKISHPFGCIRISVNGCETVADVTWKQDGLQADIDLHVYAPDGTLTVKVTDLHGTVLPYPSDRLKVSSINVGAGGCAQLGIDAPFHNMHNGDKVLMAGVETSSPAANAACIRQEGYRVNVLNDQHVEIVVPALQGAAFSTFGTVQNTRIQLLFFYRQIS